MRGYLILFSLLFIGVSSCKKDPFNAAKQAATDDSLIQAYIASNKITATKDPSGLYYEVLKPGGGTFPTINSTIAINYGGTLLNGSVFAAPGSNLSASLGSLIQGWQIGIPHINTGGRILLIIPSVLGYGNSSPGTGIPANSVLVFTIDLLSFSN